jgi:hypothetical protein
MRERKMETKRNETRNEFRKRKILEVLKYVEAKFLKEWLPFEERKTKKDIGAMKDQSFKFRNDFATSHE